MTSRENPRRNASERRLRELLAGSSEVESVWSRVREQIGGRSPQEIERETSRVRPIRWVAAAAAVVLITLQLAWHFGPSAGPRLDRVEIEVESALGAVLREVLVPVETAEFDPSTVLTLLVDGEAR